MFSITLIVLVIVLLGLLLLAAGGFLLFANKNRIAGIILAVAGLVLTLCPLSFYLLVVISSRSMG